MINIGIIGAGRIGQVHAKGILTGAPNAKIGSNPNQGAAYVFGKPGGAWTETDRLVATGGGVNDFFGNAVAASLDGSTVMIGAQGSNIGGTPFQGTAYGLAADPFTAGPQPMTALGSEVTSPTSSPPRPAHHRRELAEAAEAMPRRSSRRTEAVPGHAVGVVLPGQLAALQQVPARQPHVLRDR